MFSKWKRCYVLSDLLKLSVKEIKIKIIGEI